jgi:hypothetical protein
LNEKADEDAPPPPPAHRPTDRHDDGPEEPNTRKQTDQKRRRLAIKTLQIKTTLLFYGLEAREDEKPMVACQIRVLVETTFPRLWSDEMGDVNNRIRFLVDGRARATNHKNQFENDDRLSGEWN